MTGREFLVKDVASWRKLPDAYLAGLTDEERDAIRQLEAVACEQEQEQLAAIVLECHNRFQFAKTYKLLRADLRNTLSKPGNPNMTADFNKALKAAFQLIGDQKLSAMARWFYIHFADAHDMREVQKMAVFRIETAIEVYAGREDKQGGGCAGMLLLIFSSGVGLFALKFFSALPPVFSFLSR